MGQLAEEKESLHPPRLPFDIRIACSDGGVFRYLARLIRKSTGSSVVNSTSIKGEMREEADAFLTQIFFGVEYSCLSQFFRSDGVHNFFGYANPQVDEMLSQLNQTGGHRDKEEDWGTCPVPPTGRFCDNPLGTPLSIYILAVRNPIRR